MKMLNRFYSMLIFIFLISANFTFSQEVGDILWEDHFEDMSDTAMHNDVGWFYYSENDGLMNAIVKQADGKAFLQTGNFANFVGAVVASSNGVSFLNEDDEEATHKALIEENKGQPNQEITFNVNFKKITNSFFAVSMRLVQRDTSESLPDSDPTHEGSYVLFFSPLTDQITLSRVLGDVEGGDEGGAQYDFLNPAQWQHFAATTDFDLELNVNYWVKFYAYNGDLKMKIWEGELGDEEATWFLEGTDPSPRVSGSFTMFSIISSDPSVTDQVEIDDVVVRLVGEPVGVEDNINQLPLNFELKNNYPNPFNPTTNIEFNLSKAGHTMLKIYSITGELVRTLVDKDMQAGEHRLIFNGKNDSGRELVSGMYIYELSNGSNISAKKMFLLK
ncbi:MAG: T9SS type A sorting domain-containing protein [Ignavibacteriales bacterium]|nr:T9SS type A sorting domain-containing protein [Ignavibacteriales bacterium]